jgi:spore germination cell wall hydrolase CwlJ-like protein
MTNNLVKLLFLLAFSTSQAVAKTDRHPDGRHHHHHDGRQKHASHHPRHHSGHRLHQALMPQDSLTCLANTAYREARNSDANMRAVLHVAKNRLEAGWGDSYCQVIRRGRFVHAVRRADPEAYARAQEIARKVMQGELSDNTHGAVYFHSSRLKRLPGWAKARYRTARIDGNVFYADASSVMRVAME